MSEAPEAATETQADTKFLTEDEFGAAAAARMAEVFGGQGTPEPEPASEVETPAAEQPSPDDGVRRNAAGRAIDETGKFIAEPDPAAVDTSAAEEKYATPEEAYRAAQEARQLLDRQREEVGQTRAEMAAMRAEMEALKAGVTQRLTVSGDDLDEMIDDDPAKAAQVAYMQGDADRLPRALEAWKEDDPYAAAVFTARLEREYEDWQRTQQSAANGATEQAAPATGTADFGADVTAALEPVVAARPDMQAVLGQHGQAVLAERPLILSTLRTGTPEQRAQALTDLYDFAKMRHVNAVTSDAETRAQATAAEQAAQARADAAVVSASQGSASTGQPTEADQIRQMFREGAQGIGAMRIPAA